ncbi:MAG: hypothetical protein JHC61_14835 [Burkholderiaceae bacterium]|nr:hypothetical protein [Burkholderiaceae bacterium]
MVGAVAVAAGAGAAEPEGVVPVASGSADCTVAGTAAGGALALRGVLRTPPLVTLREAR